MHAWGIYYTTLIARVLDEIMGYEDVRQFSPMAVKYDKVSHRCPSLIPFLWERSRILKITVVFCEGIYYWLFHDLLHIN